MKVDSQHLIKPVLTEIEQVLHQVDEGQIEQIKNSITKDKRIFVLGSGRSGLMAKAFAMRLMHIGYTVYVIGETITPAIAAGDVLVAISGSGKTSSVLELSKKAKDKGVVLLGVTSNPESSLATISSKILVVPGATKFGDGVQSIQLLSTLFDQTVHIVLDILCLKLSIRDQISNDEARAEHSNME